MKKALRVLGKYLDDLLALAAGTCFITAAAMWFDLPAALAVAGVCLAIYAVAVARSKGGK
jgi:hypothetical protein